MSAPTLNVALRSLEAAKDGFVRMNESVRSVSLTTKGAVRKAVQTARAGRTLDAFVTLCPFYDGVGGIRGDVADFSRVSERMRRKYRAAVESARFLQSQIPLRVTYLLADQ